MKTPRLKFRSMSSLVVLLALMSLVACKKDSDPTPKDGVEGNWQITAITFNPVYVNNGIPIGDLLPIYALQGNTCPSKTTFAFKGDGSVNVSAPTECKDTKDELTTLLEIDNTTTWTKDNNKLLLKTGGSTLQADLTVDKTSMTLAGSQPLDDGKTHTISFVFKRI